MQAQKDTVIQMHYVLKVEGEIYEDSREHHPLTNLLGHGALIPGMEKAIYGHSAGDSFSVDIAANDAYGERNENAVARVAKKYFKDGKRLRPGMRTVLTMREGGQRMVTVRKVGMSVIDVDTNHPLAGKDLHFDIELLDVRAASKQELAHGHAHTHAD